MTGKIKDKEDGLWVTASGDEFFMYYKDTFMYEDFKFESVVGLKDIYLRDTLLIPYEFL